MTPPAAAVAPPPETSDSPTVRTFREVGRSVPRLEGTAKVDGSVEYIYNLRLPGMLHGKIHRSSIAHGRIVRIDTSAALAVEGVHAVFTAGDIATLVANPYYGPGVEDTTILAIGHASLIGV